MVHSRRESDGDEGQRTALQLTRRKRCLCPDNLDEIIADRALWPVPQIRSDRKDGMTLFHYILSVVLLTASTSQFGNERNRVHRTTNLSKGVFDDLPRAVRPSVVDDGLGSFAEPVVNLRVSPSEALPGIPVTLGRVRRAQPGPSLRQQRNPESPLPRRDLALPTCPADIPPARPLDRARGCGADRERCSSWLAST